MEALRVTILAQKSTFLGVETAKLQCYPSNNDVDVSLDFGRTAPIPSQNASELQSSDKHCCENAVYFVTIPDFGPFYCLGSKSGMEEKVSAFFTRADGKSVRLNFPFSNQFE